LTLLWACHREKLAKHIHCCAKMAKYFRRSP
jgi:hypothetical protein